MDSRHKDALKARQHKKKRPLPVQTSNTQSSSVSVNALKSKIRDVNRVLEHAQRLPLEVRIEKERALAGYRQDLEKAQHEKEKQRMIKRYHMVRFFERQKATRNLKKLRTRLASAAPRTPEYETIAHHVHCAEVDLNYTLYSPLTQKYVGIFPRQETSNAEGTTNVPTKTPAQPQKNKPAMWTIVELCMANGTLQALRDGKLHTSVAMPLRPQRAAAKISHRKAEKREHKIKATAHPGSQAIDDQEGGSEGGFFEE
ncbi:MAG: hypothetical protein LQ348_007319 [Seirophora lacunosa]|nr:MAG: hypothetical protein LQ348_007319 [Seirophora lacunosa]